MVVKDYSSSNLYSYSFTSHYVSRELAKSLFIIFYLLFILIYLFLFIIKKSILIQFAGPLLFFFQEHYFHSLLKRAGLGGRGGTTTKGEVYGIHFPFETIACISQYKEH